IVEDSDEPMDRLIRQQVLTAIEEADVVVLMVDGREGTNPLDYAVAARLRRSNRPVLLLVNKVDRLGAPTALQHHDYWDLGLCDPLPVSSLSGKGSRVVPDAIGERLPAVSEAEEEDHRRVAAVGVTNVAKSSVGSGLPWE